MDETKVFKTEKDGMLMEFATGLINYCSKRNSCEGCVFEKKHVCQIDYPECWILAEKGHDA